MNKQIKVWDSFIRGYHWLMVILVATLFLSAEFKLWMWHFISAFMLLALLLSRLIWAIVGSDTARFTHFIASPARVINYFKTMTDRNSKHYLGHNPGGGYMVLLFFVLLAVQLVSGLFVSKSSAEGPLSYMLSSDLVRLVNELHEINSTLLLIAIGLHVLVIGFYKAYKKQNLIIPMITGVVNVDAESSAKRPRIFWGGIPWILAIAFFCVIYYLWIDEVTY